MKCNRAIYTQTLSYMPTNSDEKVTLNYFSENSEAISSAYVKVSKTYIVRSEFSSIVRVIVSCVEWLKENFLPHQIINKCETGLEFPDVKIDTGIDSIIDR